MKNGNKILIRAKRFVLSLKVFDTVHHNLLLAKLKKSYLLKRFQRVNTNNKFSEQSKSILEIITRVNYRFPFVQYFH